MTSIPTAQTSYQPSGLASFVHSFPHINLKFKPVPSVFNLDDKSYLEALMIIAGIPIVFMGVWIVIYMLYFCYFCITCRKQRRVEKQRKSSRPGKWFSFIFSALSLLAIAACIFSNELIAKGLKKSDESFSEIGGDFKEIKTQSLTTKWRLEKFKEKVQLLSYALEQNSQLDNQLRPQLLTYSSLLSQSIEQSHELVDTEIWKRFSSFDTITSSPLNKYTTYELYRRLGTHGLSGFLIICLSLTLCSLGTKRKPLLLACVACIIMCVITVWIGAGFYSGLSVASGDFCVDPYDNSERMTETPDQSNGSVTLMRYYTRCSDDIKPFSQVLRGAQQLLLDGKTNLSLLENAGGELLEGMVVSLIEDLKSNMTDVVEQMLILGSVLECTSTSRSYSTAINELCTTTLLSMVIICAGFLTAGLFISILVFTLHSASRYVGNRRAYFEVDASDQFVSREPDNRSDNPLYYRFSQISTGDADAQPTGAASTSRPQPNAPSQRSSPPPAYAKHSDFYSTYGNTGTLDSNGHVSNDLNRDSNSFRLNEM